ncbi:L-arabinose ABC transporter ATP-binding protein AraG [Acidisoma cladoniae]|jgi:L-arabinose transport system ATP-binding protein|uniref:L-arabinose ABC transporter ATP-binding protein AraG n=1 Tax=Acidisoma cladoniae TaxID=3040935 RepID=UPI00254CB804|nr:L-arabinose ABC transporter ATP-binding protein AraG [Acidisoma sp. PAMC 29798]
MSLATTVAAPVSGAAAPFLSLSGITVEFPGVKALKGVDLAVERGSVHALMGENGAGKSTLLKVLSGVNIPAAGTITLDGQTLTFRSAADALQAGIAIIYQELHLVPALSVAENLMLGHVPRHMGFVDRGALRRQVLGTLRDLGEDIEPDMLVSRLSIGQRQMVEIGKALLRDARVIAFDEPTSSLSAREIENLKRIIRRLRDDGRAIIYVTHRMAEVFEICDAVTVFRDGACVAVHNTMADVDQSSLVREMVGRSIEDIYGHRSRPFGKTLLEVEGLIGPGVTAPASFSLRRGEVLGFFGLVGAGRTELMRLLCGARKPTGGRVQLDGKPMRLGSPRSAIRQRVAMCPEDRKSEGIFPIASVGDNINVSVRRRIALGSVFVNRAREDETTKTYIERLGIRTPSGRTAIRNLSGGNQQKVILGRWLAETIDLLVLDEPTRGIDVGARSQIYDILYTLAEEGRGIIVVSSDLPEVMSISDRIVVMREGRIVGEVLRDDATPEMLLAMALPQ